MGMSYCPEQNGGANLVRMHGLMYIIIRLDQAEEPGLRVLLACITACCIYSWRCVVEDVAAQHQLIINNNGYKTDDDR